MGKRRFKVDKLVRDKIPASMHEKNITMATRVMGKDEFIQRLQDKLLEEANEVIQSTTRRSYRKN